MRTVMIFAVGILTAGCSQPTIYVPAEKQSAFQVASAKCRAAAMNAANSVPQQGARISQTNNINIAPQGYNPNRMPPPASDSAVAGSQMIVSASKSGIDAYNDGLRERQIRETAEANYNGCMAAEGWVQQE